MDEAKAAMVEGSESGKGEGEGEREGPLSSTGKAPALRLWTTPRAAGEGGSNVESQSRGEEMNLIVPVLGIIAYGRGSGARGLA